MWFDVVWGISSVDNVLNRRACMYGGEVVATHATTPKKAATI